ncbi:hypothetical protein N7471_001456 [Penicillium samsonianum]|uniref:uncharacterized protein n=1 Tax=Penicillium samsonianum TaxID=1882272 RepID=UPI0025472041|nr:uncharacterized protein N7471_001456 [Penicillium samsonianum]KAJ6150257.1 hypothetical protein N7471_001456 [Penicillium samsonianum]
MRGLSYLSIHHERDLFGPGIEEKFAEGLLARGKRTNGTGIAQSHQEVQSRTQGRQLDKKGLRSSSALLELKLNPPHENEVVFQESGNP